jgi:hypothetical protein
MFIPTHYYSNMILYFCRMRIRISRIGLACIILYYIIYIHLLQLEDDLSHNL